MNIELITSILMFAGVVFVTLAQVIGQTLVSV